MNRSSYLLFVISFIMLTGCAKELLKSQSSQFIYETNQAEAFIQQGQHKQAAVLYQTLSKSDPTYQVQFSLLATQALIQSGDSDAAQSQANSINPAILSDKQRSQLNLLYAQISLSRGEAEQALYQLSTTEVFKLPINEQITYYQSLAFAQSLTGNLIKSVQARINISPLLKDDQQRYENNSVIINSLKLLSKENLALKQPPAPDVLGGWMALTQIFTHVKLKTLSAEFETSLIEWKRLFPQHPANSNFLQIYLQGSKNSFKLPSAIALLLPESGRFAQAAQVIKKGFMLAYNQSNFQPVFRFYDSARNNPVNLYNQAISEGAGLIIGPLSRRNIQSLALSTELPVSVLALNHVENLAKDNLFQFGLSPIDDARQISEKARYDGHKKALLLTPATQQGKRIANYIGEYWQASEGIVLEAQSFNPKESDFSQPIKNLLNLDESRVRFNSLRRFLSKNLQYTERRRQDVDAIFISASPRVARSIYPQLRFYRANRVPVYATSKIYSGQENSSLDRDLNSITFCDIPWLFSDAYSGELSKQSLPESSRQFPSKYIRLLALGIDAFNIISELGQLDITQYPAATGILSLDRENRISRQLSCAKFIGGKPVLQNLDL